MKRSLVIVALACMAAAIMVPASSAAPSGALDAATPAHDRTGSVTSFLASAPARPHAVAGEVVVTYRAGADALRASMPSVMGAQVVARAPGLRMQTLRLAEGANVDAALRRLRHTPGVATADPNFRLAPLAVPAPNDTYFANQWALRNTGQAHVISDPPPSSSSGTSGADVHALDAWGITTGAAGSVIAVIDTGVDTDHPDLVNQLVGSGNWANFASDGAPTNPNPNPSQSGFSHGTHVSGIIAAQQNNSIGISGICPSCKILPIRFGFTLSSELQAIDWAIDHGADVINASYGGAPWNKSERNAIKAAGQEGILFVSSAGNSSADNDVATFSGNTMLSPNYPASYGLDSILAVAASNHDDQYGYFTGCVEGDGNTRAECSFTSFGRTSVDVAAPGTDILSTVVPGNGSLGTSQEYDTYNGTSMASPMVAGIAGLVLAAHPGYTPTQVKNAIMNSVQKPDGLDRYLRITSCSSNCSLTTGMFSRTNGRVSATAAIGGSTANATKKDDGTITGAKPIAVSKSGAVDWPSDPNDVYKKSLKKGKRYKVTVSAKGKALDLVVWDPTTVDLWQLSAGCLGGPGACPLIGGGTVKVGQKGQLVFKAKKAGVHYFQLSSFYQTAKATYTISVKLA